MAHSIQDRLIPCRSQTNMALAQYLLSSMSHRPGEQPESRHREVTRILNFGTTKSKTTTKWFAATALKTKCKIPTKPDRVMSVPGTFINCGFQNVHYAQSANNVVIALETGVYVNINEDFKYFDKVEMRTNNQQDQDYPYCLVIWNNDGTIVCGKMNGEIQICDLLHHNLNKWNLTVRQALLFIAMKQDYLLTCGTVRNGVRIYDIRRSSGSVEPILTLKSQTGVNCLAWSSNGQLLAGGCDSGETYLWDIRHPNKVLTCLKAQEGNPVQAVNWCPWKPSVLLSGSGFPRPSICLQNTASGVLLDEYECASEVTGIQFNSQLKQVATSHSPPLEDVPNSRVTHGAESTVQLWQVNSSKMFPLLALGLHKVGIFSMAASLNGNKLVTIGGDELLCLWNWSETGTHPVQNKAGTLPARSQLDALNLIR